MPEPCYPWPRTAAPERTVFRRSYFDPLGEPMSGSVTVVATSRVDQADSVVPEGAQAVAELVDGLLELRLRPGYYRLTANLHTVSGHDLTDEDVVTIAG